MDGANNNTLPQLTDEERANPYTRISFHGLEVQLWQVAHIYGLHELPSPVLRSGACSGDFRALHLRQHDEQNNCSGHPSDDVAGGVNEDQPLPDSPTLGLGNLLNRGRQYLGLRENVGPGSETRDLIRLIDELADETWHDEADEEGIQHTTAVPAAASSLGTTILYPPPLYADPSFPPPLHPPPNRPLPPVPQQAARNRPRGEQAADSALLPGTALSLRSTEPPEYLEPDRDVDLESERTITPRTSRQQLVAVPRVPTATIPAPSGQPVLATSQMRAASTPTASRQQRIATPQVRETTMPAASGQRLTTPSQLQDAPMLTASRQLVPPRRAREAMIPVASEHRLITAARLGGASVPARYRQQIVPTPRAQEVPRPTTLVAVERSAIARTAGEAAPASILRDHGANGYCRQPQRSGLTEPLPQLPRGLLEHLVPDFLLNPPSFLQHPPNFSQQPHQDQHRGMGTRGSPGPSRSRSSSNQASAGTRPVTPAGDDDIALTSRWSPDSSPEMTKLKKVRKALSFAKLRPRKSRVFQPEAGNETNEPTASAGKRTSGSSASHRSSGKTSS